MENIALKPGKNSTEFIGKLILQIIVVANLILNLFKLPSLDISPEMSLSIAGGIEGVWMIFRQWNKRLELVSQTAIHGSEKLIELEDIKGTIKLKELQAAHAHKMEQIKAGKEPTQFERTLEALSKEVNALAKEDIKKKGSDPNAKS